MDGPLSPAELDAIDAYWSAANYLSAGQIYLLANPWFRAPPQAGACQDCDRCGGPAMSGLRVEAVSAD